MVALAALAAGCLPWFVPSLLHAVQADPAGVAAFAARADAPFSTVGSLLMLGGAWNVQTVPAAYGGPWSALWLAVVIAALAGYVLIAGGGRSRGGLPGGSRGMDSPREVAPSSPRASTAGRGWGWPPGPGW